MAVRIGSHVSSAGGVAEALERAQALGCQTLQVFTASPRQWRAPQLAPQAEALGRRRRELGLRPLVVHANYLINLAGDNPEFHRRSLAAFRAELERAAAVGADYLVLHPGSGDSGRLVASVREASAGFHWGGLELLLENMAGGETRLGGTFGRLAELIEGLAGLPVGACLDTCHAWVSGYDLVSAKGYAAAMRELQATVGLKRVRVVHANDAKAGRGSHLDRHAHVGAGQLGVVTFRRMLRDRRWAGRAFIVETPPAGQAADLAELRRAAGQNRTRGKAVLGPAPTKAQ
ncbi:MAG: deoxyribonuclease IV [Terriglobales bacterium]